MSEPLNLIKQVCKDQSLTHTQLGELIGYGLDSIRKSASTGKISESMQKAIELYLRNVELEQKLSKSESFKNTLKEWLKD